MMFAKPLIILSKPLKWVCTRSTKSRLEELEAEEERIKENICREQLQNTFVTEDQIWYIFDRFRKMDLSMPDQQKKIIDTFLHSIVLYDDKLVISFNYREHPKTIMLDDILNHINSIGSDFEGVVSPKRKADARLCKISGKIE